MVDDEGEVPVIIAGVCAAWKVSAVLGSDALLEYSMPERTSACDQDAEKPCSL